MIFKDREEAGKMLGVALANYAGKNAVVLALPRGGIPVAKQVAEAIESPTRSRCVPESGTPDATGIRHRGSD